MNYQIRMRNIQSHEYMLNHYFKELIKDKNNLSIVESIQSSLEILYRLKHLVSTQSRHI